MSEESTRPPASLLAAVTRAGAGLRSACPRLQPYGARTSQRPGPYWAQSSPLSSGWPRPPHPLGAQSPRVSPSPPGLPPRLTPVSHQGRDFGYVTREPRDSSVSGLDSFGNLEVSPPVVANGREYPLGRILIGGNLPG